MPNPDPFAIRIPWGTATNDQQNNENWRAVQDWDRRVAATGRTRLGAIKVAIPLAGTPGAVFDNIPQTFNNLIIKGNLLCDQVAGTRQSTGLRINGDTGANYWWQLVGSITGAAPATFSAAGATSAVVGNHPGTTTSRSAQITVTIMDYACRSIPATTPLSHSGLAMNELWDTTSAVTFSGGFWHQATNPITQVSIITPGNWIAPSSFYLYGEY